MKLTNTCARTSCLIRSLYRILTDLLFLVLYLGLMLMASYISSHFDPENISHRDAITISMIMKYSPLLNISSTGITIFKDPNALFTFALITEISKSSCLQKS